MKADFSSHCGEDMTMAVEGIRGWALYGMTIWGAMCVLLGDRVKHTFFFLGKS